MGTQKYACQANPFLEKASAQLCWLQRQGIGGTLSPIGMGKITNFAGWLDGNYSLDQPGKRKDGNRGTPCWGSVCSCSCHFRTSSARKIFIDPSWREWKSDQTWTWHPIGELCLGAWKRSRQQMEGLKTSRKRTLCLGRDSRFSMDPIQQPNPLIRTTKPWQALGIYCSLVFSFATTLQWGCISVL